MEVAISGAAFLSIYWIHHLNTRYGGKLAGATPLDPLHPPTNGTLVYVTGEVAPVNAGRVLTCGTPPVPCVLYSSETRHHITQMVRRLYGGYKRSESTETVGRLFRGLPFLILGPEGDAPIARIPQLSTCPGDLELLSLSESYTAAAAPSAGGQYLGSGRSILGTSTVEWGLPSGTAVTAIGELVVPPSDVVGGGMMEVKLEGTVWPGVLTRESFVKFIARKRQEARLLRYLVLLSFGVFVGLAAWRGYRVWKGKKVTQTRRRRKSMQLCGACGEGSRDIMCNPCHHRCVCADCAVTVTTCPMCGEKVDFFSP